MKRIFVLMFSIVLMVMLVACGSNKVDDATEEKYIDKAKDIVNLLNENNYEDVHAMFGDEMEGLLPVADMEELTPVINESGDFEEIDKASVELREGMYTTVLAAKYSDKNRVFTISFNDDDEVTGLFIQ